MKELIIVSPTARMAAYCLYTLKEKYSPIIKKVNRRLLLVELLNGDRIYFKYDAQGEKVLKGFRGEIAYIDSFEEFECIIDKKMRNDGMMTKMESEE